MLALASSAAGQDAGPTEADRAFAAVLAAEAPDELRAARDALLPLVEAHPAAGASALVQISMLAHELGDTGAARSALEELDARYAPAPAAVMNEAIRTIEALIGSGSTRRGAVAAEWALAEVARSPSDRGRLLIARHWALRALGAHAEADAAIDALEGEVRSLARAGAAPEKVLAYFEAYLHLGRAQGWMSLGVLDRAAAELERAIARSRASGDWTTEFAATMASSDLFLLQERRSLALDVIDRFLAGKGELLGDALRANLELQRAVALAELERIGAGPEGGEPRGQEALRAFLARPDGREALVTRAELELVDLLLREPLTTTKRTEAGRLLDSVEAALGGGTGPEIEALAAAQRARWLLAGEPDGEALDAAIARTTRTFAGLVESWRQAPRQRPGGLGFLHLSYRRMLISELIELHLTRDPSAAGVERALQVVVDAQAEGGLVEDLGGGGVTLDELRARYLGERHGCLVLLPGRHVTHLFAFDRERSLHRSLPARTSLRPVVESFLGGLYASPERRAQDDGSLLTELEASAAALSRELFGPELRGLLADWERVTVVGTELLGGLPLESLPTAPGGELLGLTHAVDVVPSLPLAARLAELDGAEGVPGPGDVDLILVADLAPPDPEADMRPVPADALLARVAPLLEPFDEDRRRLLAGPDARWPAVARLLGSGSRVGVLHVLAHGAYDPERERGACLALRAESGGRVYAEDVEALPACARIVVLSACASARGPERLGSDNLSHLGGAFLRAGARAVVLTRAQVLLGRTLRLDRELHAALAEGRSLAEAVRRARVAALDGEAWSPYLLGRVQVYGLGSARWRP